MGIDLIWGYTGILSLGHGVYFGLGAYCMAMHLKLAATPNQLPDFMSWSGVESLPWFWVPFHSAGCCLPTRPYCSDDRRLHPRIFHIPQPDQRRFLLHFISSVSHHNRHVIRRPARLYRRNEWTDQLYNLSWLKPAITIDEVVIFLSHLSRRCLLFLFLAVCS